MNGTRCTIRSMAISPRPKIHHMPIVRNRRVITAKWIFGRDAFTDQDYLVHIDYPAFLAKIGYSHTEAVLAPMSYAATDHRSFYDYVWFDPFPGEGPFLALMQEAEDAFRAHRYQ